MKFRNLFYLPFYFDTVLFQNGDGIKPKVGNDGKLPSSGIIKADDQTVSTVNGILQELLQEDLLAKAIVV
jgi:hypothetical protein